MYRSFFSGRSYFLVFTGLLLFVIGVSPAFAAPADHLIISEVLIKTRAPVSAFGSPFIEIVNPTGMPVPMENIYLTDGTMAPETFYYNITLLDPAAANPGGGFGGDFHAKFPAGFTLAVGDSIVIALNGSSEYLAAYGRKPDFELFEEGLDPDDVPELLEAFPGSIGAGLGGNGNVPVLTDVAESLVLYYWDGMTNLVQDLDYLIWGVNTSVRFDKTGVTVGGENYVPDTPVASQVAAASAGPTFGSAMRRTGGDEGTEITTGGNGIGGHDETSENLATTFPVVVGHQPPSANPPFPVSPIFTGGTISPAAPTDGQPVTISVLVVDVDEVVSVEFHYSINGGAYQTLAGTPVGPEEWTATVPAQSENTLVAWYCVATNTQSGVAVYPAGSPNFASTWTVEVGPDPGVIPAKLLLTEISTTGADQEYIEIYNPGAVAVDLSDYYLTDANYNTGNQFYYRIGEGNPTQVTVGGGAFSDFHARFPNTYFIAAGDTIVISVAGSTSFFSNFGFNPDLELYEDAGAPDDVPDMLWIFGVVGDNSIISPSSTPSLTNGAETVILFHFITGENKVTDIDVFVWKDPSVSTTTSHYFNKTGVTIGSHSYLPENGTNDADAFGTINVFGNSYQRIDPTEGNQTPTGSNGVGGRDETSEDFDSTFAMLPYDPSAPSPYEPEPNKLLFTEISTIGTDQEYIEICNPGIEAVDLSDYYLTDAIYSTGNQVYWRIAEGIPTQVTVGGGAFNDFHARFPDGYILAAGDTIVITVAGSDVFYDQFQFFPHLELYEDGAVSDTIPDMRWIFGDEINNSIINRTGSGIGEPSTPSLTNSAETVVLYHWLTGEDKVTDIDVFAWKDPSSTTTSIFFNKTGVTVGSHSYLPETGTNVSDAFGTQNDFGNSYQRIDPTEGSQIPTGSNGVDGRDETSEDFDATFAMLPYDPASQPGVVIPPVGDWQNVGFGPVVDYPSVAHTWGDFYDDGIVDLFLVMPGPGAGPLLIHNAGLLSSGSVESLYIDPTTEISDCVMGDSYQNGTLDVYMTNESGTDWFYSRKGDVGGYYMWGWPVDALGITPTTATTDAQMVDTDLDGWLEIFVTNGDGNNQLPDSRFSMTDLMPHSLLHDSGTAGSAWCDLDGDRDPDLAYVAPEGIAIAMQDDLRRFTTTWLTAPTEARDIAWADYDNDGDFDFALVCLGVNNVIYENLGDGTFAQTPLVHAGGDSTTGCNWGDFDNDGFIDLHVTNANGPNVLWSNDGGSMFNAVEDTVINNSGNDRGSSWIDIDADGDLDLYISNPDGINRFVRNNLDATNNWLQLSVKGRQNGNQTNQSALGTVIEVETQGTVQRRYVGGQEAGPGHSPLAQHFGLGGATIVDRITVFWPFRLPNGSFHRTELVDVTVNQLLEIEETVYGVSAVDQVPRFRDSLKAAQPNPFNPATVIGYSLEREEVVTLDVFDVRGRLVRRLVPGRTQAAGPHQVEWRGKTEAGANAPSGVYIFRITAGEFTASRRMVLIK